MRILILDDDKLILESLSIALTTMGHSPFKARTYRQAQKFLLEEKLDLVLLDLFLGNDRGTELIDKIRGLGYDIPIIVFTGNSSIETAVESIKNGAYDYLCKPIIPEQIHQVLKKLEKETCLKAEINKLNHQIRTDSPQIQLESRDSAMQNVYALARRAAKSEASILLLGPSGTGKTVLARNIHENSARKKAPFITVNCPSFSKELFESELFGHMKGAFTGAVQDTWGKVTAADGGTLFLDEIGEIPMEIQSRLLRLLQDRQYERLGETKTHSANIRLIAATNRDLKTEVKKGTFREDLYYRINVIQTKLPCLAERKQDILPLARNYLEFFAQQQNRTRMKFAACAENLLQNYSWPGNLRELRNVIERSVILSLGNTIRAADLPEELSATSSVDLQVDNLTKLSDVEEAHIRKIMGQSRNVEQAAKTLGIDTATLYRKKKKLRLT